MNRTEDRIVIRDTYGYKIYEIFLEDGALSCSDYILGRHLREEEASQLVLKVIERQKEFQPALNVHKLCQKWYLKTKGMDKKWKRIFGK